MLIKRGSETMNKKHEEDICGTPCLSRFCEIRIKILLSICVNEKRLILICADWSLNAAHSLSRQQ